MTDIIADSLLLFCNVWLMLFIAIVGLFFINRLVFYQVFYLGAIDIVLNVALKGTFKVPLQAPLLGYAFPSGHMQLAVVFYVWLGLQYSSRVFRMFVVLLLIGIGAGLIHYRYHDVIDIFGGLAFGLVLLGMYAYLLLKAPKQWHWALIGFASIAMIYNGFIYNAIPLHAWVAYGTLLGLALLDIIYVTVTVGKNN